MLSVIMLSVIMLSVFMLSVIMLSVVVLTVVTSHSVTSGCASNVSKTIPALIKCQVTHSQHSILCVTYQ